MFHLFFDLVLTIFEMNKLYFLAIGAVIIAFAIGYTTWNKYSGITDKLQAIKTNSVQIRKMVEVNNKLMQEVIEEVNTIPADLLQNLNIKTIK